MKNVLRSEEKNTWVILILEKIEFTTSLLDKKEITIVNLSRGYKNSKCVRTS